MDNIIKDIKNYTKNYMADNKDRGFVYHNFDHVYNVFKRSCYLAYKEGIDNKNTEIIQIAALFHDIEFANFPKNHEYKSAITAEEYLKNINFSNEDINFVKNIILSTSLEKNPSNIYESIVKDADLDNIGRYDFFEKGDLVRKEIEMLKGDFMSNYERLNIVYNLLQKNDFYTSTQKTERQYLKKINEEKVKQMFEEYKLYNNL